MKAQLYNYATLRKTESPGQTDYPSSSVFADLLTMAVYRAYDDASDSGVAFVGWTIDSNPVLRCC
jgi:hypothetical protein